MNTAYRREFPILEQQNKESPQNNRSSKKTNAFRRRMITLGSLFVISSVVFGYLHFYHNSQLAEKQHQQKKLQKELTMLQKQNKDLDRQIKLLNDEDYVLKLARKEYHFSKDGEIIFW